MKVLFIAAASGPLPDWTTPDGEAVELIREDSVADGAARVRREPVDAVVVDAAAVARADGSLDRLFQRTDGVPLLLLTPEDDRSTGPDGVLPAGAGPAAQALLLREVVKRSRLEAALSRSESRFRNVIEGMADAVVVVDRAGVIRYVNRLAAELLGGSRDSLVGTSFGYPMSVGESTEIEMFRNGDPPAVMEMRVVESEWEGDPACIASLRDITGRRRAEEAARSLIREQTARSAAEQAARRYRFLAESTAVLASSLEYERAATELARLCVDGLADWAVVYEPAADGGAHRLDGAHRQGDGPGRAAAALRRLRECDVPAGAAHPVMEVRATGQPRLLREVDPAALVARPDDAEELELLRELGAASAMVVPLTARGRNLGALELVSADAERRYDEDDLTLAVDLASRAALAMDNARLYRKAQDATRTKSDLLAVISHDLRTPLNSIIGYSELMVMGVPEPLSDGSRDRVERIRAGARHLLQLINQILALSRLEAGREEPHLEDVELNTVVREVGMVIEPLAQERHIALRLDLPESTVRLRTDADKVRQVLTNLAANAVKFTEEGEVRIALREDGGERVSLQVSDTGPGIAAEHMDRIFEPFWQVGGDHSGDKGTGLGLSVVQRLVDLLGGTVSVESEVGVGSRFTVELGSATAAQHDDEREAELARPAPSGGSELARYRDAVAALESRFRKLIQKTADGVVVVDPRGTVRFANRAAEKLFGRGTGELDGEPFGFPVVADETTEVEIVGRGDADGTSCVVELRVVESEWEGEPACIVSLRDITDRRRAEKRRRELMREQAARAEAEAAAAASRVKTDFLAVMSHELRTPLAAIIGYTELLDRGVAGPVTAEQQRFIERIRRSSDDLLHIIDEILAFADTDSDAEPVKLETTSLGGIVDMVRALAEPMAHDAGLDFRVRVRDAATPVETDTRKVRRILLDLLSNAVKFTPEGRVALEAEADAETASFTVSDTGIGIAQEHMEAIFDEFWQVERPLTRTAGGTGIGLTLARGLARSLGGEVEAVSEIGVGSAFTLRIPRRPGS